MGFITAEHGLDFFEAEHAKTLTPERTAGAVTGGKSVGLDFFAAEYAKTLLWLLISWFMVNFLTSLRIAPKISQVYQLSGAWCQVVEATSRRSYASHGVGPFQGCSGAFAQVFRRWRLW